MTRRGLTFLLATTLLVGCGDDPPPPSAGLTSAADSSDQGEAGDARVWTSVPLSESCDDAMADAAAEPDSEAAEPLIAATLSSCFSVDEWFTGLEKHPAAMGLRDASYVQLDDVVIACHRYKDTAVCEDAIERGLVDG